MVRTEDRVKLKSFEQKIVNEELTADEVTGLSIEEDERAIDSTTPEKERKMKIAGTLPIGSRKRISSASSLGSQGLTNKPPKTCGMEPGKFVQKISVYGQKVHNSFKHYNGE